MGFSLRDKFNEATAQINPFDSGKSAVTVRRNREAQVAQTVRKKQDDEATMNMLRQRANQRLEQQASTGTIPTSRVPGFGVRKPEISQAMAYNQNKQNIMFDGDKTQMPKALPNVNLNQGLMAGFRNVVDSNSPVDQVNRAREGRAISYRQSELDRGNMRPMENIGQQLLGNSARLINTAGQALNADTRTGSVELARKHAQRTGDNRLLEKVLQDQQAFNKELSSGQGGLLNAGNFLYNNEADLNMSKSEALKRSALNAVGTASEVLPFKINPMKTAGLTTRLVANAGVDTVLGAGESSARQYLQTGRIDPKTVAVDSVSNALMGVVPTIGGALKQPITTGLVNAKKAYSKATALPNNVNLSDNMLQTLGDFGSYKLGEYRPDAKTTNDLFRQSRAVARAAGIDINTGSPVDINNRIGAFIEQYKMGQNATPQVGAIGKDVRPDPLESLKQEARTFGEFPKIDTKNPVDNPVIGRFEKNMEQRGWSGLTMKTSGSLQSLSSRLKSAGHKTGVTSKDFKGAHPLDQVIKNDELFNKYPQLKDYTVVFADFHTPKKRGMTVSGDKTIFINSKLYEKDPTKLNGTLVHEIQHIKQDIRGMKKHDPFNDQPMSYMDKYNSEWEVDARRKQQEYTDWVQNKKNPTYPNKEVRTSDVSVDSDISSIPQNTTQPPKSPLTVEKKIDVARKQAKAVEKLKQEKKITPNDEGYWSTPIKGEPRAKMPDVKDVNGLTPKEGDTIKFSALAPMNDGPNKTGTSTIRWVEPQIANASGEVIPGKWVGNGLLDNGIPFEIIKRADGTKPTVKPTLQDALEGKSTKPIEVTSSTSSVPELSVSSPRNSGQQTSKEILQTQKTQPEIQGSTSAQSLTNYTTKTREVKLNTDRLNPDSGYAGLAEMQKRTTEVVDTMSNKEVQSLAKDAGIDTKTHTPEQIKKKIAEQLNVRQDAVRYMNEAEVARKAGNLELAEQSMMKAAEAGRISRAQGSELGQQLQARRIIANQLDTPQQRIFKLLDNAGINPEAYVKRLSNVDFNNPKQVIEAYRDLVPAKGKDWIDVVRYNSMLSSPLTHMVNAMSNSVNVGVVAPLEKTLRGVSDAVGGLFGKERKYAAGEGIAYMTGSAKNIKKAANEFISVLSGKSQIQNLDLNEYSTPLATKGVSGAAYKSLSVPTQLLGASDKFFRTLAEAGEENALKLRQSKGIKVRGDVKALAEAEGSYRLFQQDTDLKGQGALLGTVDSVTNSIMNLRNKHMVFKFVFPFVKTPSNILKQGIEFSPLGAANLIGNSDKATALTRMAIGTAVFGTAASMIASGDMTWGEPTNADARDRFRAEGRQPYSIRIGGKWVAFNKLPPAFSYPMALTAGIHDAVSNGDMTEETGSKIFEGIAKYGQFLSDQSYAKNIGDTLNAFKGDPEKAVQAISNYPQQLVPFRALTGWIARMSDNTERRIKTDKEGVAGEIDKQVQSLMQQYPFLRQKTGTRDYEGQPIPANNPVLNAFSPLKITDDRGTSALDTIRDQKKAQDKEKDALRESLKTDEKTGKPDVSNSEYKVDSKGNVYANIDGEVKSFDSLELYQKAKAKADKQKTVDDFLNGDEKMKEIDGKIYMKSDDTESGYTTKSKAEYNFDKEMKGVEIELDKAKASEDYETWLTNADKKYKALIAKRDSYDPDTEFDKIDTVDKQILNLEQEYEKYQGYGGKIKKGKKGSKTRASGLDFKMFAYGNPATSLNSKLQSLLEQAKVG